MMATVEKETRRGKALEAFRSAEVPAKTVETWRRLPFANWRTDEFSPEKAGSPETTLAGGAGAELSSLEDAASANEALLASTLKGGSVGADFLKLEAANLSAWTGGAFVRVPKGKRIEEPIRITFRHDASKPFQTPRAFVLVEEGAEATIVEEHLGGASASIAFSTVVVGAGAKLRYFYTQELPREAVHFWHQRVSLDRDSHLDHTSILMGGHRHKSELEVILGGRGAHSDLRGVLFGSGEQFFDPHTQQLHRASNTVSDMHFRTALRDKARSIYTGLIRVEKDALDCEAYQQNKNLLLSDDARADSTPVLEILPDRVACKHGATAGPVDPNQLFYLAARGISPAEAAEMLIMGFFEPVLERLPFEDMRERLRTAVAAGAALR